MSETAKALRVHADGAVRIEDCPVTPPGLGELSIRARYSAINYKDALAVTGTGKILRSLPMTPGIDVAGEVERSSDPRFEPGDPVLVTGRGMGERVDGAFAERVTVKADHVVALPTGMSLLEAAALGTAGFTAALALLRLLDNHQAPALGPLLITGASGGVGSIAVSLFAGQGYEVVALSGKPELADWLRGLGAQQVLLRHDLEMGERPLESARWGGAVDNLGGDTLAWITRTTKPMGNIAAIGLASGVELHTTVMPFILRGVSLIGIDSVNCPDTMRSTIWSRLAHDWKPPRLDAIVAGQLGLDEIEAYCQQMLAGKTHGRMVVRL
ncbi:MAG: YhdH/YhfP family quinone oxidoreductase [Thiotrichales bacterium]